MSVAYDAAVLIAAEHSDRRVWADHRTRLELGILPWTTAPVVAQVSRSPRQVQLRRLLRGCSVEAFAPTDAHLVGNLLARAGTSDVVDAHLITCAARTAATVLSDDLADLSRLANHIPAPVSVKRL